MCMETVLSIKRLHGILKKESSKNTLTQDHAFHSGGGLGRNELLGSYHIPVGDQDLQCDNA